MVPILTCRFIDQSGAETESVFGGQFKDDPGGLKLKHDRCCSASSHSRVLDMAGSNKWAASRRGLLSMANAGPDTNTSHFSIMLGPAHHLDGSYTIFGEASIYAGLLQEWLVEL